MGIENGPNGVGVVACGSGAKALRMAPADNDGLVVTLTRAELAEMLRQAQETARPRPLLVDKKILAHLLGVSAGHIDNLRKDGMPTVMVGQTVRFEPEDVMSWLRGRRAQ